MTFAKVTGSPTLTVLVVSLVVRFAARIDLTTSRTLFSLGLGPSVINSRRILIIAFVILHKKDDKELEYKQRKFKQLALKKLLINKIMNWSYKIGGEVVVRGLAVK